MDSITSLILSISLLFVVGASAFSGQTCPTELGDPGKIYGFVFGKQHPKFSPLEPEQTLECLRVIYENRGDQHVIGSQVLELIQASNLNSSDNCWQNEMFKSFEQLIMFHYGKQHTLNIIPYLYHFKEAQFKLSNVAASRALEIQVATLPGDRVQRLKRFMQFLAQSEESIPEWPYFRSNWPTLLNGTYHYAKEYISQVGDRRLKLETYATAFEQSIGADCSQVHDLFSTMYAHFRPLLSGSRKILKRFSPQLIEWLKVAPICGHLIRSKDLAIKETYEIIMKNVKEDGMLSKFVSRLVKV